MEALGKRVRALRTAAGLSQRELADRLDLTEKSIQRYESGRFQPDAFALSRLASFFDVPADYLLGLTGIEGQLELARRRGLRKPGSNPLYRRYLRRRSENVPDEGAEYYWISLREDGTFGGQTEWVGWADADCSLEIRRLRPVIADKAAATCREVYGSCMILNEAEDVRAFLAFGGEAIVRADICAQYLPEFPEDYAGENPQHAALRRLDG